MAGAALGHAVSHVTGSDLLCVNVERGVSAEEGEVALDDVIIVVVLQTIIHTHTLTHSHSYARARAARTLLMHTRGPTRRSPYPIRLHLRTVSTYLGHSMY